jgi:serine/threonine protein kinase
MMLRGRFTVGMVLGYGGFGIIYKAWDKKLQSVVALKEYFPSGIVSRVPGSMNVAVYAKKREMEFNFGFERFIDEAKNMAKFGTHSNIVNVYGYFEENQTAYIVMEYLDGGTLSEFLKDHSLDINASFTIIKSVNSALKAIHAAGIVHRDVSPDNVFICSDGRIKLIDFGAARFSLDEEKLITVILKPGYAPPEQYEKVNVQGPWTDIYAVGATLYLMLTGIKPDESTNRKIKDTLVPPAAINPAISENISNTIMKAMALDKHLRFKTIEDFEKGLKLEVKVIPLKKEIRRRKRRRLLTVLFSTLVVLFAVSAFAYLYNMQRMEETLQDARILIWYELTGNSVLDMAKTEAYSAIIDAFRSSYANIEIVVEAFESWEYSARVQAAIEAGSAPTLFESTSLDSALISNAIDLSGLVGRLDMDQFLFLERYATYFPQRNQLPLGFSAPVVYVNTTLSDITGNSIPEDAIFGAGSREQFFSAEAEMFVSDTMDFLGVQEALPARYRLLRIDAQRVECSFRDLWSISNSAANERRAAEWLLLFMLSENAQDFLYIRNSTGALPLRRAGLQTFVEVHTDFIGFFENIESYTFH